MPADNNQFKIDYDYPGLCAHCHVEIAEFNGSNKYGTPIITKFKPNFTTGKIEINDGSGMTITLCSTCDISLKPEDMGELMESVINGLIVQIQKTPALEPKKQADIAVLVTKFITQRIDKPFKASEVPDITKPNADNLNVGS